MLSASNEGSLPGGAGQLPKSVIPVINFILCMQLLLILIMMDDKIFKGWAGSLCFLILILTLWALRLDHAGGKSGARELFLRVNDIPSQVCSSLFFLISLKNTPKHPSLPHP